MKTVIVAIGEPDREKIDARLVANAFGERLSALAHERGLSGNALADRTGLSTGTVWSLMRGKTQPQLSTLLSLQAAFELGSVEQLLGELPSVELMMRASERGEHTFEYGA